MMMIIIKIKIMLPGKKINDIVCKKKEEFKINF